MQDCPCENEKPDPCPRCGATVESGACGGPSPEVAQLLNRIAALEERVRRAEMANNPIGPSPGVLPNGQHLEVKDQFPLPFSISHEDHP